jgi:hypothetical protein
MKLFDFPIRPTSARRFLNPCAASRPAGHVPSRTALVPVLMVGAALAACGADAQQAAEVVHAQEAAPVTTAMLASDVEVPFQDRGSHWAHIRTMATAWTEDTPTEQAFIAHHFDWIMGGNMGAFKRRNPEGVALPYALVHTVMIPGREGSDQSLATGYYADMQAWFAARPQCSMANAFLHRAGTSRLQSNRLEVYVWTSHRWAINLGDPCAREYTADRIARIAGNWDGVFIDEHGDIERFAQGSLEYPDIDAYFRDDVETLRLIRQRMGDRILQLNTAEFQGGRQLRSIAAAGSAHLEMLNNPQREMISRWEWVDQIVAAGAVAQVISAWGDNHYEDGSVQNFTPGNSATRADRGKLFELASFYMVSTRNPAQTLFTFADFRTPYHQQWIGAIELDVGLPTEARRVLAQGRDPSGQRALVFARRFENALVLARPQADWDAEKYGDETAFRVTLPAGIWYPVDRRGRAGAAVTSLQLRNGEGAILMRSAGATSPPSRSAVDLPTLAYDP